MDYLRNTLQNVDINKTQELTKCLFTVNNNHVFTDDES